ncbi:methyltransferase family protein [Pseudoduganella flava]|uniref:Methyltransferase domain-containing protein n=1 Tax=Pseudoduganella flava TaxID=871742 RepID=A0A562Q572_9BURK|nr:class I SAM-dependent methyltransferase [Pseudoduganella flava]QGZ41856.1 methyltransferase domain-containing protein [Pseudoduganella flava]TWI51868.1 methyltransferase family protein [Pseudoduganella flava]
MKHETLAQYYALNAGAIESVYDKPERQADLAALRTKLPELLRGHKVLEIACGTGYWTRLIAATAASVHATDVNDEAVALARAHATAGNVTFAKADAFDLPACAGEYTAVFAGFWWSHVKREEQERFLAQLRAKLGKDVLLVLLDNCYVDGSSTAIARTDAEGNTYQIRTLASGERFEIVKNFPADSYLRKKLATAVREIRIERLPYYWLLTCRLK